ncbi:MAG TPA: histidine kinase [Terrimicrobiaceae bacterium]|nr:histidine kinase [Terrimicrobiaceae bacterium]
MSSLKTRTIARVAAWSLASNAAVLFALGFGLSIWPDRLPANSQNIFWLASGVNTAGLLIFGLRVWPVLLLNALPPWLLGIEPLGLCAVGASANAGEAVLAAWIILRFGRFTGHFDSVRAVGALAAASFAAPLVNTLVMPAFFCWQGMLPWSDYGRALGNWNLSNGTALLVMVPLIAAVRNRGWNRDPHRGELFSAGVLAAACCFLAFDAVFRGTGMNFAFIIFPVVIYTAVRFSYGETSLVLGIAFAAIYAAAGLHGRFLPPAQMAEVIWFVQAFCWVLAATGLFLAALVSERRDAENRSLQASLGEERARLAALRYQINPHFLFNALNSVRAVIPVSEPVPREMITDLASYLRSALESPKSDRVALMDEVRSARDYLAIEQRRFGDRLRVAVEIAPGLDDFRVPVFLLQPLVENAIRHGLEKSKSPCDLRIAATRSAGMVRLEVSNSGQWTENGRSGVGLENVRRRLALISNGSAALKVDSGNGQVRVVIDLPANGAE